MHKTKLDIPSTANKISNALLVIYPNDSSCLLEQIDTSIGIVTLDMTRSPVSERHISTPVPCPACHEEATKFYNCVRYPQKPPNSNEEVSLSNIVDHLQKTGNTNPYSEFLLCQCCWETVQQESQLLVDKNSTKFMVSEI